MDHDVSNVACTVCGCVCDDLRIRVENGHIVEMDGACELARPWLLSQSEGRLPLAEIEGQSTSLQQAVRQAAEILQQARAPLIYGLSRSSTEGQRAAISLADRIGATIDTTASLCHAPSVMAVQESGESTCTLGEIKNRADLVIFWGSNPVESHPRHLERYSLEPQGLFVPQGRAGRTLVVVDVQRTPTAELADLFIPVEPGHDFEALWALRSLVRGQRLLEYSFTGSELLLLEDLAERMKNCRCGVVFFGLGLSMSGLGHRNVEALLRLVMELNDFTRFYVRRMRVQGDVAGADSVLAWQTGYPFSVNLGRGYPRYNPEEFSAHELLERGEADAFLLLGSETDLRFSDSAMANLQKIPRILLNSPGDKPTLYWPVRFTTAVHGLHCSGTAYRMDEVPIPLRPVLSTDYPTDAEVLGQIEKRINGVNTW